MDYGIWDVALTAAAILNFDFAAARGRSMHPVVEKLKGTDRLVLLIVDSLGYSTYQDLKKYMPDITGLLLPVKADSWHTTPAIATILLGCRERNHHVMHEENIYDTSIDTVLEAAERCGHKAALIIEKRGADAMFNRIDTVVGVENDLDIVRYDAAITEGLIGALRSGCNFAAAHLRALNRSAHEHDGRNLDQAARSINDNVKRIISAVPGTALLVVGDHPLHLKENYEEYVALIAMSV